MIFGYFLKALHNSFFMKKLSNKQESRICLDCGECCKRYYITVLPEESKKISKKLKSSEKEFLEKNCELHVKIYPKSVKGILTYPSTFFPKHIYEQIRKEVGIVSDSYFIVPQVVLKRDIFEIDGKKICTFLNENNTCKIYSVRPEPCRLFPFIAVEGIREQYPFCELYQKTYKDLSKKSSSYFKKVKSYFKKVNDKGFLSVWKNPPKKGLMYLADKYICEINLNELNLMLMDQRE